MTGNKKKDPYIKFKYSIIQGEGGKETYEDRSFIYDIQKSKKTVKMAYFIIADGVGVSKRDYNAANTAIEVIENCLTPLTHVAHAADNLSKIVKEAIMQANEKILEDNHTGFGEDENQYDSTTLDICIIQNGVLQVFHVGDSRVYLLYKNGHFKKLTKDENKTQVLVDRQKLTENEQKVHPKSKSLLNAAGIDNKMFEPIIYDPIDYQDLGIIFMATDGLYGCMTEEEIEQHLQFCYANNTKIKDVLLKMEEYTKKPKGMIPVCMSLNKIQDERIAIKRITKDNYTGILVKNMGVI